jgi:uncharacterized protein (UPF0333 family)
MRLSPFSLIALLAVLAIVAYLTVQSIGSSVSPAAPSGVGSYQNAINAAKQSVAAQNQAGQQAGGSSATP